MKILFLDFETFSKIDLKKCGLYRYARDPSTRVLMLSYAVNNDEVEQWVPADGEPMPLRLRKLLRDPSVIKSAWNAQFERVIFKYVLGIEIPYDEWRCSMIRAMTLSFPGSLDKAGDVVGLPAEFAKDKEGKKLITLFCQPNRRPSKRNPFKRANAISHPDEWERFKFYNRQDIEAERAMYKRTKRWDLPAHEWEMWFLDQEINERGMPLNIDVVNGAIEFLEYYREKMHAKLKKLTGVENTNSRPQLLAWLQDNGYVFDDMKKGHIESSAADMKLPKKTRDVLNIRLEVSRTSPDKFYAMQRAMNPDKLEGTDLALWIVQGAFQFAGAQRTWRWSGRIFQPQNLPRPNKEFEDDQPALARDLARLSPRSLELIYPKPMDMLATAVRPTIQAPDGYMICAADLNAIENRVLGWMSGDERILDCYRNNRDPYLDFASYLYDTPYAELYEEYKPSDGSKGDKSKRTIGKPGALGCGYMLSAGDAKLNKKTSEIEATGLLGYAWNMGVKEFTLEEAKASVTTFRSVYADVVKYWYEIDKAVKYTVRTGRSRGAGPVEFDIDGPFLRMRLPTGRYLHYCRPLIEEKERFWCMKNKKYMPLHLCEQPNRDKRKYDETVTYEGLDDRGNWNRLSSHPGKWTENADQAMSRDCLAIGMRRYTERCIGLPLIVLHVHDEFGALSKEKHAPRNQEILLECLSEPIDEMPGLPLGAAGALAKVWIKD